MTGSEQAVVLARAAWSRLAEPGDEVAGALVQALGPTEALAWLRGVVPAAAAGGTVEPPAPGLSSTTVRRLSGAAARWAPRLTGLTPERDVEALHRRGGELVVPGDARWPSGLDDLGAAAPHCLWVRGHAGLDLAGLLDRAVAVVGSRACTAYGEHVTGEVVAGLARAGCAVVSGGAYGIDAVAHRTALAVGGPTVAVLAGGVDRAYPAGNARLLAAIAEGGGALVGEVPPGSIPTRSRFLQRNRLIAALSRATVVVEAAWRSGALSSASHAAALLRPVGAVPGPVTSAASAGCHRLLREGAAVCVTDAAEVLELVGGAGADLDATPEPAGAPTDGLTPAQCRALDALPVRQGRAADGLSRVAGLSVGEVRAALGVLELRGLAERHGAGWRRGPECRRTS